MDRALKGHSYAKSPIDMACWDILGQASGKPVAESLGGCYGDDFHLYRAISQDAPQAMATTLQATGLRDIVIRLKVGGDPETDVERIRSVSEHMQEETSSCGCQHGWLPHEAMRVVRGVADVDVYIEQPVLDRGMRGGSPQFESPFHPRRIHRRH